MEALRVSAAWRGGYAVRVDARGHRLKVDEPVEAGGDDGGPMPTELFCASLASCFCLAVAHVARKRGIDTPGLRVDVVAQRAGSELRYDRFRVTAAAAVEHEQLAALVERARRFCWISNTLAAGTQVEYRAAPAQRSPEEVA